MFRLGLIINPLAGVGGSVALKGSDGADTVAIAFDRGAIARAEERCTQALALLEPFKTQMVIVTVAGVMGGNLAAALGFSNRLLPEIVPLTATTADDTRAAAKALCADGLDLLLFVGGDGTARDIYAAVGLGPVVLGVPAGVKMQSGVYANSPQAAGRLVSLMIEGALLSLIDAEVRDIDEEAYRQGKVRSRHFGQLRVPADVRYLQQVKCGGLECEELVLDEIAADVMASMDKHGLYIIGAGTTTQAIKRAMGIKGTLLGVDLVLNGELFKADATEQEILAALSALSAQNTVVLIVTLIGGQGHLFGRGNQQLSPAVIRAIGRDHIWVVASKDKLNTLNGRPMLLDTGDQALNHQLSGYMRVITGYEDYVIYPVSDGLN
jgi:predicted polyphosphate/ATP-dependent NAD kinase